VQAHFLLIQSLLRPLAGVESVSVAAADSQVLSIRHTLQASQSQLAAALKRGGYRGSEVPLLSESTLAESEEEDLEQGPRHEKWPSQAVRSQFHVGGICCAMEIPVIRKIVKPLSGVETLQINITTKMVYVQHDIGLIEAQSIAFQLTKEGFPSEIVVDGAVQLRRVARDNTKTLTVVRSEFVESTVLVSHLRHQDMTTLQNIFRQNYRRDQVRAFFAHVPSHTIKLEHNPELLPIRDIPILLEQHGFNANVAVDGKEAGLFLPVLEEYGPSSCSAINEGGLMDDHIDASVDLKYHVVLSGLFWVLSMFSVAGGVL
jgi:hypothetical protein